MPMSTCRELMYGLRIDLKDQLPFNWHRSTLPQLELESLLDFSIRVRCSVLLRDCLRQELQSETE